MHLLNAGILKYKGAGNGKVNMIFGRVEPIGGIGLFLILNFIFSPS